MSKTFWLLDPGHGGLVGGKYVTPGKRSPLFDDGKTILYEGVNNRDNVQRIIKRCAELGISAYDIVGSNEDVPLQERTNKANVFYSKNKNCVYISVHSDAAVNEGWSPASGISVYTSPGQTKSDVFATLLVHELEEQFGTTVKFRKDGRDGDPDYEENFWVLRKTLMPAVLIEGGFHTNKEEAARMLTDEWKNKLATAVTNAMIKWDKLETK